DGLGVDALALVAEPDLAVESGGGLHQLAGRAGMQPEPVGQLELLRFHARTIPWAPPLAASAASRAGGFSAWLITFSSIGRLRPDTTGTPRSAAAWLARLCGVAPGRSVSTRAPCESP